MIIRVWGLFAATDNKARGLNLCAGRPQRLQFGLGRLGLETRAIHTERLFLHFFVIIISNIDVPDPFFIDFTGHNLMDGLFGGEH